MEDSQETLENTSALSSEEMKSLVVIGRALADPTRIRILGLLAERPMYGQELARVLDVKPPTVSHHIAPLVNAGLVYVRRENNYHYYELDSDGIQHLAEITQHIARLLFPSNPLPPDRKSTRLNSSHSQISYAVFCLKKKNKHKTYK